MSLIQCSQEDFDEQIEKEVEILKKDKENMQNQLDSLQQKYDILKKNNKNHTQT